MFGILFSGVLAGAMVAFVAEVAVGVAAVTIAAFVVTFIAATAYSLYRA